MNKAIGHKRFRLVPWSLRRRVAAWLGLALVLFNVAAGGTLPAHPEGQQSPVFAQSLFGERIEICSAGGIEFLDLNGQPSSDTNQDHQHGDICVFCLPLMHAGIGQPPVAVAVAEPIVLPAAPLPPVERTEVIPPRLVTAASPRAPPVA